MSCRYKKDCVMYEKKCRVVIPLGFRKAGRVGGAQETHLATYHYGVTPSKTREFLPAFLDLNGRKLDIKYVFSMSGENN